MTMMRTLRLMAATVSLGAAGVYLFVYLYRWEWNRALIAGVFLIVAEIALVASVLSDRLRRIEMRLAQPPIGQALQRIQEVAPPMRDHFEWLRPNGASLSVFVPVMIGAGAVLSGVAWLVERLSRFTAQPLMERGLATRLEGLTLPEGGLVGPPAGTRSQVDTLLRPSGWQIR